MQDATTKRAPAKTTRTSTATTIAGKGTTRNTSSANRARSKAPQPTPPPEGANKLALIVHALRSPHGATIADLIALTGWQAHSLRGAMAGALKKRGHVISSDKIEGSTRIYRIEGAA